MRIVLAGAGLAGCLAVAGAWLWLGPERTSSEQPAVAGASPTSSASRAAAAPTSTAGGASAVGTTGVRFDFGAGLRPAATGDGAPPVLRVAGTARIAGPAESGAQRATLSLRMVAAGGGLVEAVPHGADWALRFPARCVAPACPKAIMEADPASWLSPGGRPFRWGATVRLDPDQTSAGSNVVQKGFSAAGGQFKLQIDGTAGRPSCVLAGSSAGVNRIFVATAPASVADGRWHVLGCARSGDSLVISVDGAPVASVAPPADLVVDNDQPLRLGGKGSGPENDQFHGILDDVYVDIE